MGPQTVVLQSEVPVLSGIPLPAPTASQISLQITGMTCAACVSHVSDALLSVDGVEDVAVNLATEKATISLGESNRQSDSPVDLGILGDALKDAGYGGGHPEGGLLA